MSTITAPIEVPLFQPPARQRIDLDRPRPVRRSSWLVSKHGKALFVTESDAFLAWYVGENPGAVAEEVTDDVPAALARTAG